jgi:AcrR family transcriptional regulator
MKPASQLASAEVIPRRSDEAVASRRRYAELMSGRADEEGESRAAAPLAVAARGRPRHPDTDRAILGATFRQLVDVGYGGLSIEAVAAAAGVAKTTMYRRYPAKRDLVIAALESGTTFVPLVDVGDTRAALAAFVRRAIGAMVDSGAIRILGSLLVEDAREPDLLDVFRRRLLDPRRAMVVALIRRGIARGDVRADVDPLVVTEMIAGAIFGHHAILGQHADDAWIEALVGHIWAAIRARPADAAEARS